MSKYGDWTRGEEEALLNILGGTDVARAILRGEKTLVVKQLGLLRRIGESVLVSGVEEFVADEAAEKAANIGWTGDSYRRLFRDKCERGVPKAQLAVHYLERASLDIPILAELGDRAEVSLAYVFDLLKKQVHGEQGILLTNGYANIFYVRGTDGNLWAVNAHWFSGDGSWAVEADSVESPLGWDAGHQILSRDS